MRGEVAVVQFVVSQNGCATQSGNHYALRLREKIILLQQHALRSPPFLHRDRIRLALSSRHPSFLLPLSFLKRAPRT